MEFGRSLPQLKALLLPMVVLFFVPGCFRRAIVNTNCKWPYQNELRLDLRNAADQTRLRDEVQLAEELAVRYMDERRRIEGEDAGRRRFAPCMNALFARIATLHGVGLDDIERARTQRNRTADFTFVVLPMATLFVLISNRLSKRIFLSIDDRLLAACVTLVASALVAVCAVLVGEVWAELVETIRIGNDHLSFRAGRIPWSNQHEYLFVAGVLLFWLVAGLQHQLGTSRIRELCNTPRSGAPPGLDN